MGVVGVYWSRSWRVSERECSLDERSVGEGLWEVPEMGSRSEAVELFEALLDRASPLGLYCVEMHPATVTEELGQRLDVRRLTTARTSTRELEERLEL